MKNFNFEINKETKKVACATFFIWLHQSYI